MKRKSSKKKTKVSSKKTGDDLVKAEPGIPDIQYTTSTTDIYPENATSSLVHDDSLLHSPNQDVLEAGLNSEEEPGLSRMQQLTVEKKLKYLEPPVYFYESPEPQPLTVSFDYPGTDLTHIQVLKAVMSTLENIPNAQITSVRFVARNVILGIMWTENRWVIELSTKQCVTVLLGRGIAIKGEPIKIRKYDDILKEDYTKFLMNKDTFMKKGQKKSKGSSSPKVNAMSYLKTDTDKDGDISTLLSQTNEPTEITVL